LNDGSGRATQGSIGLSSQADIHRNTTETFMKKLALIAASCGFTFAAFAGEIANTTIDAVGAENLTNSNYAVAWQEIGVTTGTGRILNSYINAHGARNHAASRVGLASQRIGVADNGTLDNVRVWAQRAFNQSTASGARAYQEIGTVGAGGKMSNVTVFAEGANNRATQDESIARQRIGMVQ
jgi:hypothetical protein